MAKSKVLVNDKVLPVEQTKVVFGLGQLTNDTPVWVKNTLKLTIVVTSVLAIWISSTKLIISTSKEEIQSALAALDLLVLGVSRFFGVEQK